MADKADNKINYTSSRFSDFCTRNPAAPHPPISQHDLMRLDHTTDDNNILRADPSNDMAEIHLSNPKCCCGRPGCAYLEHNNAALGGLERDLETAARLGQALLERHETYVKESQAEQARLSSYVHELENEKSSLQDANHRVVVENRELLSRLEQLNTDFGDTGKRVNELEDLLQGCEQEIKRLNGLTRRTQELELRVMDMERERAELARDFEDGKSETRTTIARWQDSERKVRQLEQEVQKIEWAARVDRERHEEIVARMERDRNLERELDRSEGRLKATAAIQTMQHGGTKKQVVSNFVRDILQDNASLQAGIAELRELLQSSNDEVQNLREQVMLHQPVLDEEPPTPQRVLSLGDELSMSQSLPPKQVQQELHVHHHYHAKVGAKKDKTPVRKIHRRRAIMPPGTLSSSPSSSGVSTPVVRPQRHMSSPVIPLTIQPVSNKGNRWSMQSTATTSTYLSSLASSPRSHYDRNSSIFDRIERDEESSRPTSPESYGLSSPLTSTRKGRIADSGLSVFEEEDASIEDLAPLDAFPDGLAPETEDVVDSKDHSIDDPVDHEPEGNQAPDFELTPKPSMNLQAHDGYLTPKQPDSSASEAEPPPDHNSRPLDHTSDLNISTQGAIETESLEQEEEDESEETITHITNVEIRPSMRPRSNSHESLFSLSGMDIHIAQQSSRSTLALLQGHGANKHHFAPVPPSLRQAGASTAQPLATVTEYTATSKTGLEPAVSASMMALSGIRSTAVRGSMSQAQNKGLIGSVGGWMSSKWGRTPTTMKSVTDLRSAASSGSSQTSRPSVNHFPTSPIIVNSSAKSITPSTTSKLTTSSGGRSISTTAIDTPTKTMLTESSMSGSMLRSSFMSRPPGINQSGPIPGFAAAIAAKRAPTVITPTKVDLGGLEESLAEQ